MPSKSTPRNAPGNQSSAVTVVDRKAALASIEATMDEQTAALAAVLGDEESRRFKVVVARAIAKDEKLIRCTPLSLMRAMMDAASIGIEPTGKWGGGYLVPFWNSDKSVYEATLIVGYDGLKEMAYRSKIVTLVEGAAVREHDRFEYIRGFPESRISHELPAPGTERGELIGAWAMVFLDRAPRPLMEFLPAEQIEKRRRVSRSGSNRDTGEAIGIWRDWKDEMYMKTALRSTLDLAPKSVIDVVSKAFEIEDLHDSLLRAAGQDPAAAARVLDGDRRKRLQAGAGAFVDAEAPEPGPKGDEQPLETTETGGDPEVAQDSGDAGSVAGDPGGAPETQENAGPDGDVVDGEAVEVGDTDDAPAVDDPAAHPTGALALCGDPSPYDVEEGQEPETCGETKGHGGHVHRSFKPDGTPSATWKIAKDA